MNHLNRSKSEFIIWFVAGILSGFIISLAFFGYVRGIIVRESAFREAVSICVSSNLPEINTESGDIWMGMNTCLREQGFTMIVDGVDDQELIDIGVKMRFEYCSNLSNISDLSHEKAIISISKCFIDGGIGSLSYMYEEAPSG